MEAQFHTLKLTEETSKFDNGLYEKYLNEFVSKFQRKIGYGTAGFREKSSFLEHVSKIAYLLQYTLSFFRCFYVLEYLALNLQGIEIKQLSVILKVL